MGKKIFERIVDWINSSPNTSRVIEVKVERPKAKKSSTRKGTIPNKKDILSDTSGTVSVTSNKMTIVSNRKGVSTKGKNTSKLAERKNDRDNSTPNNVQGQNPIEKKDNLISAIMFLLQTNYRGEHHSMKDKVLSISILDSIFYDSVNSSDFKKILETSISDELGMVFNRIEIKDELLVDINMSELFSNVYIGIKPVQTHKTTRKAVISSVANNGSTISTEYFLDSEEIAKLPNCRYNIGAGKHPILADNSYRENHIAIDDDPNSCEYAKNKYVSRSHANISYSEELGFLLNVEYGGSRAAQKRTYIHRGNEKIELNNTLVPVPLRNGDYIVLSKYVYLLFKEA